MSRSTTPPPRAEVKPETVAHIEIVLSAQLKGRTYLPAGPRGVPGLLVNNEVTMQGFVVFSYAERNDEARAEMSGWVAEGRLKPWATVYEGFEAAPGAFVDMLAGRTAGTTVVRW